MHAEQLLCDWMLQPDYDLYPTDVGKVGPDSMAWIMAKFKCKFIIYSHYKMEEADVCYL